jgi:hypothetical protein
MKETFKGITKEDVKDLEKKAELSGKLNYDDPEQKYEGESTEPIDSTWDVSEASIEDIKQAENIQKKGRTELLENNKKDREKLELLQKKYAKQIVELNQVPRLEKEITIIEYKKDEIESEQEPLRLERDVIDQTLANHKWREILSEEEVRGALLKDPNNSKLLKSSEISDKITKIISLGLVKPSGVAKLLDWKAEILLSEKIKNINAKLIPLKKELISLEMERYAKSEEVKEAISFFDSPDWDEFISMRGLGDNIDQRIKELEEIKDRATMN